MDAGQFDMLHDAGDKAGLPVTDRIGFGLDSVVQEAVDEDRPVWGYADGAGHIDPHFIVVVDDLHAPAAQDVGGPHHYRVSDPCAGSQRSVDIRCHIGFRHGDMELLHHFPELIPVLGQVDGLRGSSQNPCAGSLQGPGQVQRGLAAELGDDANGFSSR